MRRSDLRAVFALALMLGVPRVAQAQASAPTTPVPAAPRLRFAGVLGLGFAAGNARPGLAVRELIPTPLVFGFDGAWGPVPNFDLGLALFARLGLGTPNQCPVGGSCAFAASGDLVVRARYHFRPASSFDPWLGLGAGLEVLESRSQHTVSDSSVVFNSSHTVNQSELYYGPVLAMPEVGFDYRPKRSLAWGAFLVASVARYTAVKSVTSSSGDTTASSTARIDPSALHEWIMLLAHVTFDVGL